MCNEVRRRIALGQMREDFAELRIPLRFPEGLPNLEPTDSVRITDRTLMIRQGEDGAEGVMRRWSWPARTGRPVYNIRSEGRDLSRGRCLIPVDGFYEFTAPADPRQKRKDKWLFTMRDEPWFCLAALWRRDEGVGEAFALLTTEPGPDVAPYHSRQVVVLGREQWGAWLGGGGLDFRASIKEAKLIATARQSFR